MAPHSLLLSGLALMLLVMIQRCPATLIINPLPLSGFTNGTALFFGGPADGQDDPFDMRLPPGACGYGQMDSKLWPFYLVAGISPKNSLVLGRPQASCGTCLEVKCASTDPKVCTSTASITVVITDECPQCSANQLNLHAFAFEQIAPLMYGSTAIQYRQVECSPADNITVRVDGFRVVQGGWLRLSLKSVASDAGIVRVELARSTDGAVGSNSTDATVAPAGPANPGDPQEQLLLADSGSISNTVNGAASNSSNTSRTWKPMDNTYGAEWEMSALPAPPYDLRLTDKFGRQVVLVGVLTNAGGIGEFPSRGQFNGLENKTSTVPPTNTTVKAAAPASLPKAATPASLPKAATPASLPKAATPAILPKAAAAVPNLIADAKPTAKPATTAPAAAPTAIKPKPSIATTVGSRRRLLQQQQRRQRAAHHRRQVLQGTREQA